MSFGGGCRLGRSRLWLLGFLAATVLGGCGGVKTRVDFDPTADFVGDRSYRWLPGVQEADRRLNERAVEAIIQELVDDELQKKGYKRIDEDSAAFQVTYQLFIDRRVELGVVEQRYQWGLPEGQRVYGDVQVQDWEEGTLTLDIVDSESGALIWRGFGEAKLERAQDPRERRDKALRAVSAMLRDFPPRR